MDRSVGKIVGFLEADDVELRRAAAKVLGALQPNGTSVVPALSSALRGTRDDRLRIAALEALGSVGGIEAFDEIVPLLDEPGEVGDCATDTLGRIGPKALGRLKRTFPRAGELARRRILSLGVRLRGADGMDIIVAGLESGDTEAVSHATLAAGELADATSREKNTLLKRVDKFLGSITSQSSPGSVAAALDLLARIIGEKAQSRLLSYTTAEHPARVRRRALEALAELAPSVKFESELITTLLGYLDDRDFTHVVAPAMKVLEQARLAAGHAKDVLKLVESPDPALRRFAVAALGQIDSDKSATALLGVLSGNNPDLAKRAALSLARQREAIPLVAAALASAGDAATAWVLARILHPHARKLKADIVEPLAVAAARWLEPGDPRAEPVLTVLRDNHLGVLEEIAMKRVRRIRKGRVPGEVVNLLRPLVAASAGSAEVRYELAIAEIVRGEKGVVREVRLHNVGLQELETLLPIEDFRLAQRLKREKELLTPEEFYLIGCHFAERAYADRAFGGELLRWLVHTFPEDIASRAAEHKLLMEGFPPPPRPKPKPKKKPKPKPKPKPRAKAKAKAKAAPKKPAAKKPPAKKKAVAKKKAAPKKKVAVSRKKTPTRKKTPARKATGKKVAKKAPAKKTATKATKSAAKRRKR